MSAATTRGVHVGVATTFVPERSDLDAGFYFFAYQVDIANHSDDVVQLVTRHWVITDGDGQVREVKGPGVVGETPVLAPGQRFSYVSACPLKTPVGVMQGTYQMVYPHAPDREGFDAVIAPFTLAVPGAVN